MDMSTPFLKFSALKHNIPVSEARIRQYHGFLLPGNPVACIRLFLVSGLLFAQRSEGEIYFKVSIGITDLLN